MPSSNSLQLEHIEGGARTGQDGGAQADKHKMLGADFSGTEPCSVQEP